MPEPSNPRPPDGLPEAVFQPPRRGRLPLVWIIPIVAALIGGWLAVKSILERGPTVSISFANAQGIEAGKTKIKYKDVDIGEIRGVALSEDSTRVILTAEFVKPAAKFLVKDARFWVVRPRVGPGGVSGLGTLFSGAYLGMDLGKSTEPRSDFIGLEAPPIITAEIPGRQFILHGDASGSLDVGDPIYFHRINVGQVVAVGLDANGRGVTFKIFINSPYDKYVTRDSRFWHASGLDVTLDANGFRLRTESLASIVSGGLAFDFGPDATDNAPAPADTEFLLATDRVQAMKRPDIHRKAYLLYFEDSLRGLLVGAPVDFGGLLIGEVRSIDIEYDPRGKRILFPVTIDVFPDRMRARFRKGTTPIESFAGHEAELLDNLVSQGYRAQLRMGSLLTGQLYVAFERFPNLAPGKVDRNVDPPALPTTRGSLLQIQQTIAQMAAKIDKLPLGELVADTRKAIQSLDQTLQSADELVKRTNSEIAPAARATLEEARQTLIAAQQTVSSDSPQLVQLRQTLRELERAAAAMRVLAETVEKHPEAFIRGKKEEEPKEEKP